MVELRGSSQCAPITMVWKIFLHNPLLRSGLSLAIVGFGGLVGLSSSVLSAHYNVLTEETVQSKSVKYIPPPDRGTPPSNQGTGSRGNCLYRADLPSFTALVGQSHLSLALSERPTLWAYIPYTATEVSQGDIIIQLNSDDREIYRGSFQLESTPGIVGIQLPDSMPALAVGEVYRWYIDIQCVSSSPTTASDSPATLTGVIERIAAPDELTQNLQAASTPSERLSIYGHYHIWYDLLSELARLRLAANGAEPQVEQLWQDLLGDEMGANLAEFIQSPVVGEFTVDDMTVEDLTTSSPPE